MGPAYLLISLLAVKMQCFAKFTIFCDTLFALSVLAVCHGISGANFGD